MESVAQLVEHLTFNQVAVGSNPTGFTKQINKLWMLGDLDDHLCINSNVKNKISAQIEKFDYWDMINYIQGELKDNYCLEDPLGDCF